MEFMDIKSFMYIDFDTVMMGFLNTFGTVLCGGFIIVTVLDILSSAVFGLLELFDIKEK